VTTTSDVVTLFVFAIFFVGLWLAITRTLAARSGWLDLARRFPDHSEIPSLKLGFRSGMMAGKVSLSRCLTLAVCPSGLRVAIDRWLGPFSPPFLVPWDELFATQTRRGVELQFGRPTIGTLRIAPETANRLARAAPGSWPGQGSYTEPPVGVALGRIWLGWAITTAFAGVVFTLSQQTWPPQSRPPLFLNVLGPGFVFGIWPAIRTVAYLFRKSAP
jgi:hypothetical protein